MKHGDTALLQTMPPMAVNQRKPWAQQNLSITQWISVVIVSTINLVDVFDFTKQTINKFKLQ